MGAKNTYLFISLSFFICIHSNAQPPPGYDKLEHFNIDHFVSSMTRAAHRPYRADDEYNTFRNVSNIVFNTGELMDDDTVCPWKKQYDESLAWLNTDKQSPTDIIAHLRKLFPQEAQRPAVAAIPRIKPEKIKPRTIIPHMQDTLRHTNVGSDYILKRIAWLARTLHAQHPDLSAHPALIEKLGRITDMTSTEDGAIESLRAFLMPKWTPPEARKRQYNGKRRGAKGYRNQSPQLSRHSNRRHKKTPSNVACTSPKTYVL